MKGQPTPKSLYQTRSLEQWQDACQASAQRSQKRRQRPVRGPWWRRMVRAHRQ
jgi:hypothetical protein